MPKIRVMGFGILDLACVPVPGYLIEIDGSVLNVARVILHSNPKRDNENRLVVATIEVKTDSDLVMVEPLAQASGSKYTLEPKLDLSSRADCENALLKRLKQPNLNIVASRYDSGLKLWHFDTKFPGSDAIDGFTVREDTFVITHTPPPLKGN